MFGERLELRDWPTNYVLRSGSGVGDENALRGDHAARVIRELAARQPMVVHQLSGWLVAGYYGLDHDPVGMVAHALRVGRMYLVRSVEAVPAYSHRYESRSKPAPAPKFEGNELGEDGPSLTRTVSITILDFHLDRGPLVNLPLHVVHDGGEHVSGKTNAQGTLVYVGLPPDRRFAVFSGRDLDAADTPD